MQRASAYPLFELWQKQLGACFSETDMVRHFRAMMQTVPDEPAPSNPAAPPDVLAARVDELERRVRELEKRLAASAKPPAPRGKKKAGERPRKR